jgi:signal transduction histidine kinase
MQATFWASLVHPVVRQFAVRILVVQAVFWIVAGLVIGPASLDHIAIWRVSSVEAGLAASARNPEPAGDLATQDGPVLLAPSPAVFRFETPVDDPKQGLMVYAPRLADNAVLFVNGQRVSQPVGAMEPVPARRGALGQAWEVPQLFLKAGANRVELLVVRACCDALIRNLHAGPVAEIRPLAERAHALRVGLSVATIMASLLVLAATLVLVPMGLPRATVQAIALAMGGFAVSALWPVDVLVPVPAVSHDAYGIAALVAISTGLAMLVWIWSRGSDAGLAVIRWSGAVAGICVVVGAILFQADRAAFIGWVMTPLEMVCQVALCGLVLMRLSAWLDADDPGRSWEGAILLLIPTIAMAETLVSNTGDSNFIQYSSIGALALIVMIGLSLARRGAAMHARAEAANRTLEQRVAARETELAATYQALRAQEAEAGVQRERARIMRDMHDGMGGQLLSLLMLVRSDEVPRQRLEGAVEGAINDLRLLIDSLDSVGDSLDVALAMFRERLEPRLAAAGVTLDWINRLDEPPRSLGPGAVLAVYRILQEAVSNAVRHGGATRIALLQAREDSSLVIAVRDNGSGMPQAARAGRGLTNMRRRAEELGGRLEIGEGLPRTADRRGVEVRLVLPWAA